MTPVLPSVVNTQISSNSSSRCFLFADLQHALKNLDSVDYYNEVRKILFFLTDPTC